MIWFILKITIDKLFGKYLNTFNILTHLALHSLNNGFELLYTMCIIKLLDLE